MTNNSYYTGFIRACKSFGLNKQAAAELYKQAVPGAAEASPGRIRSFFSALGRPFRAARTAYKAQKDLENARKVLSVAPEVPIMFSPVVDGAYNVAVRNQNLLQAEQLLPRALYQSYASGAGDTPGAVSRFFGGLGSGYAKMRATPATMKSFGLNKPYAFLTGFAQGRGIAPVLSDGTRFDAIRALANRHLALGVRTGNTKALRRVIKALRRNGQPLEDIPLSEIDSRISRMYEEFRDAGGVFERNRSPLAMLQRPAQPPTDPRLVLDASQVGAANELSRRERSLRGIMNRRDGWLNIFQPIANFGVKHPIITTLTLGGAGSWLANQFNTTQTSEPYSSINTLTPSQQRIMQDAENGYGLPGLGGTNW